MRKLNGFQVDNTKKSTSPVRYIRVPSFPDKHTQTGVLAGCRKKKKKHNRNWFWRRP